jgi:hypothetical protein
VLRHLFFRTLLLGLLCLAPSWAASPKGKVADPSGAVVPAAQVTVRSQATPAVKTLATDSAGAFSADGLEPGTYTVTVEAPGFDKFEQTVTIPATGDATIAISLKIAVEETAVEVSTKRSTLANADPNYRALRAATIQETLRVENVVLKRDNGVLTLRSGMVSFARPVLGRVVMAVFRGDGQFTFAPVLDIERDYLVRITEQKIVEESFDHAGMFFHVRFETAFRRHLREWSGPRGRWRAECERNAVRLSTLEGFANCLRQTGGIQVGSFNQKTQVHQVFDASIFPAHSWQRVGMEFFGKNSFIWSYGNCRILYTCKTKYISSWQVIGRQNFFFLNNSVNMKFPENSIINFCYYIEPCATTFDIGQILCAFFDFKFKIIF